LTRIKRASYTTKCTRDWLRWWLRTLVTEPVPRAGLASLHKAWPRVRVGHKVLVVGVVLMLTYILLLVVRFRVRGRNAVLIRVLHEARRQSRRHFTDESQWRVDTTFSEVCVRHQPSQRLHHTPPPVYQHTQPMLTGSEFSQVYEGSRTESEGWKGRSVFQDERWNFVQVL